MAELEVDDYVEGLNGGEIIEDALQQTGRRLRNDCNLRDSDSYPGGYDGYIEVHLNLHGMDRSEVHTRVEFGKPQDDPNQVTVHERVEIPLEQRLNLVRKRSGQGVPTLTKDEEGRPVVKKRQYATQSTAEIAKTQS